MLVIFYVPRNYKEDRTFKVKIVYQIYTIKNFQAIIYFTSITFLNIRDYMNIDLII